MCKGDRQKKGNSKAKKNTVHHTHKTHGQIQNENMAFFKTYLIFLLDSQKKKKSEQ